jgi:hypothetical protein
VVVLLLGVLGGGILATGFHIGGLPARRQSLGLRATDQGGQIHIEWDRAAEPMAAARRAAILIQDGERKVETPLSKELLQHGSLTYRRKADDVEIRLQVYGEDADPAQESTRLIGLPAAPTERLEAADRTAPSRAPPPPAFFQPATSPNYRGPERGRLIWTGQAPATGSVEIVGNRVSTGQIVGKLPDVPITIRVYPASFSRRSIVAYVPAISEGKEVHEAPSRANGGMEMVYKRDARRAGGVTVTQAPSASNNWRKIALRADRKISAVVIDWEVVDRKR